MRQLKTKPFHLSVVPQLDTRPTATLDEWWTCPEWCAPVECIGGPTYTYPDGRTLDSGVLHQRTLSTFEAVHDAHTDEQVVVVLRREQADCKGDPGSDDLVLRIGDSGIRVTAEVLGKLKTLLVAASADGGIEPAAVFDTDWLDGYRAGVFDVTGMAVAQ